jgi:hypothetical protein
MHLCDYSKAGNLLPTSLPADIHPQRIRGSSTSSIFVPQNGPAMALAPSGKSTPTLTNLPIGFPIPGENLQTITNTSSSSFSGTTETSPNSLQAGNKPQASMATTFEDKRRENFDRGNAVLEAKRQMLRDAEEREKREREEKERIEQEKKQKLKEEQDRKRMAEIEKQMERQRLIDMQREEERRKALEQREAARNELLRQQRLEWERQKKQELELQKVKLQEQLSTLKAKDKNLEYDMQTLVS